MLCITLTIGRNSVLGLEEKERLRLRFQIQFEVAFV
jgi:hypothetical protein